MLKTFLDSKDITDEQRSILAVVELNKAKKRVEIVKVWRIGKLRIKYEWRSSENLWGRFGGGWNWNVGICAGSSTVIVNVLIFMLRFDWIKSTNVTEEPR